MYVDKAKKRLRKTWRSWWFLVRKRRWVESSTKLKTHPSSCCASAVCLIRFHEPLVIIPHKLMTKLRKTLHQIKIRIEVHHEDKLRVKSDTFASQKWPRKSIKQVAIILFLCVFMSAMSSKKARTSKQEIYDFSHNNIFMAINAKDMAAHRTINWDMKWNYHFPRSLSRDRKQTEKFVISSAV